MKKYIYIASAIMVILLVFIILAVCGIFPKPIYKVNVKAEGQGEIAYAKEGEVIVYDDLNPIQTISEEIVSGSNITIAAEPFDGWNLTKWKKDGKDYSTDLYLEETIKADTEYVAVFEVDKSVVLTFDYNYGDGLPSQMAMKVEPGKTVEEWIEEREGYTYGGWYLDQECTEKFDFSTPITENITIYLKWIPE